MASKSRFNRKANSIGKQFRYFTFDRAKIDEKNRTVPIVFSSETAVDRGGYDEILDHGAADLSRLKSKAPFLLNHDPEKQIGVVEEASIEDKVGRALIRFGNSPLANEIFQDVKDGIRPNVSVGYDRTKAINRTKLEGGRDVIRFAWTPFELSSVPIPADLNTGVGRAEDTNPDPLNDPMKRNLLFAPAAVEQTGGTETVDRVKIGNDARALERGRFTNIHAAADAMAKNFPEKEKDFRDMANKAISEDHTVDKFNADLLAAIPGIRKAQLETAKVEMPEKDKKRYSMLRGIQLMMAGKPLDGLEGEMHTEMVGRSKGLPYGGMLVPSDIGVDPGAALRGRAMAGYRDLNVTQATQGGNFVPTQLVTPIIELLRNRMVTRRLGVQILSGLQGNIAIPRQSGAATAYTLAEQAVLTKSTQAIQQISLTPHRVGVTNSYSKQLILQSSVDVENFVRDDQMKVLAIKMDSLTLQGAGGTDPLGILNTTGIGSVTFGAAATWAKVLAFESALSLANADVGSIAFATTPDVRAKWKNITKISASQYASFLWESGNFADGTNDGEVNGYRAAVTNQILNSLVFFGNWEDDIVALWGGFDVVVDPYTSATSGTVNVTINAFMDNALRHAASFDVSSDSGAQ